MEVLTGQCLGGPVTKPLRRYSLVGPMGSAGFGALPLFCRTCGSWGSLGLGPRHQWSWRNWCLFPYPRSGRTGACSVLLLPLGGQRLGYTHIPALCDVDLPTLMCSGPLQTPLCPRLGRWEGAHDVQTSGRWEHSL